MEILKSLCSTPTAPFAEYRVARYVRDFVARRPRLELTRDRPGNLLIELRGGKKNLPRWVFTAHMDHPGMVAGPMAGKGVLRASFYGSVLNEYLPGAAVRFFDGAAEIKGKIRRVSSPDPQRPIYPATVEIAMESAVAPGAIGMFDQGEGRIAEGKFYCRCCDDLAGAAACLAMLDELASRPPASPVAVLLTRAEEQAFIGCIAACQEGKLLRKSDRVIAIECSAEQPVARQGDGVIVRVGDRASVFNSSLTYFLTETAEALQKKERGFRHQRALMPGGVCEATVYDLYGYIAASLCVPLRNYHNMDRQRKRIAAEYIDVGDWRNMVRLFVQLARVGHQYRPGHASLRSKVETRYRKYKRLLLKTQAGS